MVDGFSSTMSASGTVAGSFGTLTSRGPLSQSYGHGSTGVPRGGGRHERPVPPGSRRLAKASRRCAHADSGVRVVVIYFANRPTGGDVYERDLVRLLRGRIGVHLRECGISTGSRRAARLLQLPIWTAGVRRVFRRLSSHEVAVVSFDAFLFAGRPHARTIVIAHQMDFSASPWRWVFGVDGRHVLRGLARVDRVVVPSHFWRDFLRERGLQNVRVIHNGFDVNAYQASPEDVDAFRARYDLQGKPIIYLGRAGPRRGATEAFDALKDLQAHFIVSSPAREGPSGLDSRVRRLHLCQPDYIALLSAATVTVTMSSFDEGWCRVAHESLLCGTPVLGSGRGGMRELLEGAGQIVCTDLRALREAVERLLGDAPFRTRLAEQGRRFARLFTHERFLSEWMSVIDEVASL
jgi:glycosyltransferase involved in cell wall biosynthesis